MRLNPTDPRRIRPGLYGWLEAPRGDEHPTDCLLIGGWTFSVDQVITGVFADLDGRRFPAQYGLTRHDVRDVYPNARESGRSGFIIFAEGVLPLKRALLEVRCQYADGTEELVFSKSLKRSPLPGRVGRMVTRTARRFSGALGSTGTSSRPPSSHLQARGALRLFLRSGALLRYGGSETPLVSIVVVAWNRAELTFRCLCSISQQLTSALEVVLVDNGSTDETGSLLERVEGVRILRNLSNVGFTVAANQGAMCARGQYLLFLNNDAELMPGAVERLALTLERDPTIGVAGGKLVFPTGRLQEAGSVIHPDGSCEAYGRDGEPDAGEFNFRRDVDYCSGALLLTRRQLFSDLGAFDERYKPAYYEDVDYCVKTWKAGYRVVYQPGASAIHLEFGSSKSAGDALRLQRQHRETFLATHRDWLAQRPARRLGARSRHEGRPRITFIDDGWPEARHGAGFPRGVAILRSLLELGYLVSVYPMDGVQRDRVPSDELDEVEVIDRSGPSHLREFALSVPMNGALIVSRPHNLQFLKSAVGSDLGKLRVPVVYDAEAVYALRDAARRTIEGLDDAREDVAKRVRAEIHLARGCRAVLTVSEAERQRFLDEGIPNVAVLSHALRAEPLGTAFDARAGALFVGALSAGSPNEDSVRFLADQVVPLLNGVGNSQVHITVVGAGPSPRIRALDSEAFHVVADVVDLQPFYARARVFIAPTRFSAGIPLKILEAAAHGLPVVCTSQLASQLRWRNGVELLIGDSPTELADAIRTVHTDRVLWAALREGARRRLSEDYDPERFSMTLKSILLSVLS